MSRPRSEATHGVYRFARREKCKCDPCRECISRYAKQARLDREMGRPRRIDTAIVRRHLERLMDAGVEQVQISHASGVADTSVRNILHGTPDKPPAKWVLRPTAEKLLALTPEAAKREQALVSNIGIRRRIEALEFLGHPKSALAEIMGVTESQVYLYLRGESCYVTTIRAVDEAYRQLRDTQGTSERIRMAAWRRSFKPPMAWDDETIDDPAAEPGEVACVVRSCARPAFSRSLCKTHGREVRNHGGWGNARRYQDWIRRLGNRQVQDSDRVIAEIRDLRQMGYNTPAEVAYRLSRTKRYIEQIWEKTA